MINTESQLDKREADKWSAVYVTWVASFSETLAEMSHDWAPTTWMVNWAVASTVSELRL